MDKDLDLSRNSPQLQQQHSLGIPSPDSSEGQVFSNKNHKNRAWKNEEHLLYLVFLEINKERIKSKLFRQYFPSYSALITFSRTCPSSSFPRPIYNVAATTISMSRSTSSPTASSRRRGAGLRKRASPTPRSSRSTCLLSPLHTPSIKCEMTKSNK